MPTNVSPEQAAFIEEKTKQYFDYIIDCFDRARAEGNNVLQWLFGVITGGIPFIGALFDKDHNFLAIGATLAVGAATVAAARLVPALRSRYTMPPGNKASALETLLEDSFPNMRWREAMGVDGRIDANLRAVESLAKAVDKARIHLSLIPAWFAGGTIISYLAYHFISYLSCH